MSCAVSRGNFPAWTGAVVMPELICCACGKAGIVRLSPPLCAACDPSIEQEAADLWRQDNPEMSVFACDAEMKSRYRMKAAARRIQELRERVAMSQESKL
jgi:hypothetical protein